MAHSYKSAFDAFSQFKEGLATFEFRQLMDEQTDKRNASGRLSQFVKEGLAEKRGTRLNPATDQICTVYVPNGKGFDERDIEKRDGKRKRRRRYSDDQGDLLKRQLDEALRWKADAIARFPELGVDPAIIKARLQVASILRGEGQDAKAALVEAGELDDSETMRIVLSIMGRV